MKNLIKIIILLFFVSLAFLFLIIPIIGYGDWVITWFWTEHIIITAILFGLPLGFIINWIDKKLKKQI